MASEVLGTGYLKGGGLLFIVRGGWALYLDERIQGAVRIRFSETASGRMRIADLYLSDVGAAHLRRLPLRRLETAANAPRIARRLHESIAAGGTGPENAPDPRHFKLGQGTIGPISIRLPPLIVPAGSGRKPDHFYRGVVNRYQLRALETSRPAEDLAQEAGVPISTLYRWLREARRRGLMAATRRVKQRMDGDASPLSHHPDTR